MSGKYIHGFTASEQRRLVEQAGILAPNVFAGLDFADISSLLEIGCAVGAEIDILQRRWPHLKLIGLDRSASHLMAASKTLRERATEGNTRARRCIPASLADATFDCVILTVRAHAPNKSFSRTPSSAAT
jgi:trans-aconitate methyltransferase